MAKTSDRYFDLVHTFPLKPIRNESELRRATKVMNELAFRGEDNLDADEAAYLDVLSDLVEKYEDAHYPVPNSTPAQMLAFCIEQKDVTQKEVAKATGVPESTICELLSEKRPFTMNHVERLSVYFHVSPAVFIVKRTLESATL